MCPELQTERLDLRIYEPGMIESLLEALNNPEILDWMGGTDYPVDISSVSGWMDEFASAEKMGRGYSWIICPKGTDEIAGWICIKKIRPVHKSGELGFWCSVKHRRKGYISESIRRIIDFGFAELGLERLHADFFEKNEASFRVLQDAGFIKEGRARRKYFKNGEWLDAWLFAITRPDWEKDRSGEEERMETERLVLRPLKLSDAADFQEIYNHKEVVDMTFFFSYPFTHENAKNFIRWTIDKRREKGAFYFALILKETGEMVGEAHLSWISWHDLDVNLGFGIKPSHKGKGYATEASTELMRHAFEDVGFRRMVGITMAVNNASRKVLENLGMLYEGIHRAEYRQDKNFPDFAHYAILKSEWEEWKNPPDFLLQTDRLDIRMMRREDDEALVEVFNDPANYERTTHIPHPYTIKNARERIRKSIAKYKTKKAYFCSVILRETQKVIGDVHIHWIDLDDLLCEVGFAINPQYRGKGYAVEAVSEMIRFSFNELGLRRVIGLTMADNHASRRVMEKCGMYLECIAKEEWRQRDRFVDFAHYVILKNEGK